MTLSLPLLVAVVAVLTVSASALLVALQRRRARTGAADLDDTTGVFLDVSGRRWRRVTALSLVLLVPLGAAAVHMVVQVRQPVAVPDVTGRGAAPTAEEVGRDLPVVGDGPLVRVLRTITRDGELAAEDPISGDTFELTSEEQELARESSFIIHKSGYSATAQRTISLTFDDGPDPVWTPRLLDVLSEEEIPATFFVTGENAAAHPDVVERMLREGHSVANHTLTHVDVSEADGWRAQDELVLTDRIIRVVGGQATRSVRLPYVGADDRSLRQNVRGLLRAQRLGYLVSHYDFDSADWRYAAGMRTGRSPLPRFDGSNITVLLHDGGGSSREQTIEYVKDRLIPSARAAGYTFHTMPQVVPELAEATVPTEPTVYDKAALHGVKAFTVWPNRMVTVLFWFAALAVVGVGLTSVGLAAARHRTRPRFLGGIPRLPVSVLIAAYNEERVIRRTLATLTASSYPVLEIVVVDDGSKDGTSAEVLAAAETDPRIRLVRQPNGGKWSALNNGLTHLRGDIVVTLDADTVFTADTVGNLVRQFTLPGSERLAAVAGVVRVGNRALNIITRWQALEYLTQIGIERAAFAKLGAIPIVPGACAAWRRQAVLDVGGYAPVTLAEDCDLTLSLQQAGWKVAQDDDAIAYTEVPDHVDALLAQRMRWTFGTLQSLWKHRGMMFRRRHGLLGMAVLPYMVLSILVPILFLPFIAVMAFVAVREQGWWVVGLYFGVFTTVHALVAAAACRLMRESWRVLAVVPIYRVVYEPLRAYLLYTSVYLAVRGVRLGWNKLQRTGAMDAAVTVGGTPAPAGSERAAAQAEAIETIAEEMETMR
jgi:cellulose synthase/poly-beta-1,6-N-acetylglucosamine synthase-like glycosyltransferase/peptidoglycan/xylan/chitin deacetylase (PgdA/CDA1 family)